MSKFKIPKSFQLFAQTIEVVKNGEPFHDNPDTFGFASYVTGKIYLNYKAIESRTMLEQTFLHELMHFITYFAEGTLNKDDKWLHANEEFVDLSASLLHQALTTMKY